MKSSFWLLLRVQSVTAGKAHGQEFEAAAPFRIKKAERDDCLPVVSSISPFYTAQDPLARRWPHLQLMWVFPHQFI